MPKIATLTTRSLSSPTTASDQLPKNSGLIGSEIDSNFLELRDQSIGIVADDSSTIDIKAGDTLYIQGGTNCTTSTNSDGSVTINTTADQDVFKTISVAGQSDVVADGTSDGLTLVAGSNMTITTNAGSDTITFASTGGSASTGDLTISGTTISSDSSGMNLTAPGGAMHLNANVISLNCELHVGVGGDSTGGFIINDNRISTARTNEPIHLTPAGSGAVEICNAYNLPIADGTNGQVIVTNGSGVLSFASVGTINIDGGTAVSTYGAITAIDGGTA